MSIDEGVQLGPDAAAELDRTCLRILERTVMPPTRQELRPLARVIAGAARASEMLPERMVMEVRARWRVGFRASDYAARQRGEAALGDLLTLCIDEYFADGRPAPRRSAPPTSHRAPRAVHEASAPQQ